MAILGQEKGADTKTRLKHNFGMARPEGYRKARRVMQLAERYRMPVLPLIDTAGAYPGLGAADRGPAEALARRGLVTRAIDAYLSGSRQDG